MLATAAACVPHTATPHAAAPRSVACLSKNGSQGDGLLRIQARDNYQDSVVHHPLVDWEPAEARLDPHAAGGCIALQGNLCGWREFIFAFCILHHGCHATW